MKTVVRIAILLAAALLVMGAVWGLVSSQEGSASLNRVGVAGGDDGRGRLAGLGGGAAGESRLQQAGGGEQSRLGRGLGRGRDGEDQASWSGLAELFHALTVIGLIGALVILSSKGIDLLRKIPARRRSGTRA